MTQVDPWVKAAHVMTGCFVKSGSQAPVSLLEMGHICNEDSRGKPQTLTYSSRPLGVTVSLLRMKIDPVIYCWIHKII